MCRGPKRRTTSTNCRGSEKLYLRQARAYRPERRTVDGRNAKCFQSRQVALGGITFVTGKAVAGEFSIQQHHFPVAGHLGENGGGADGRMAAVTDRKSTRLNSSHVAISYAVFCLKKKNYM